VTDTDTLMAAGRIELAWTWAMHWIVDWPGMAETIIYEASWRRGSA